MAEEPNRELEICESCRELKEPDHLDAVGRSYCRECWELLDTGPSPMAQVLLATIPFKVGDRVECRIAGVLLAGVGTIDEVSTDLEKFGTLIYPSFHVKIEEKAYPDAPDDLWFMERQISLVDA